MYINNKYVYIHTHIYNKITRGERGNKGYRTFLNIMVFVYIITVIPSKSGTQNLAGVDVCGFFSVIIFLLHSCKLSIQHIVCVTVILSHRSKDRKSRVVQLN